MGVPGSRGCLISRFILVRFYILIHILLIPMEECVCMCIANDIHVHVHVHVDGLARFIVCALKVERSMFF